MRIPKSVEKLTFSTASAPDLQQAQPVSKQPMCKHMGDADSCEGGDAGEVKSELVNRFRYNLKLILSYDGSRYLGWQKTNAGRSVEEVLAQGLQRILRHEVSLQAASRTDAGVHAEGQTVNVQTKHAVATEQLQKSLNGVLPQDMRIFSITEMEENFHPTLDCTGKEYVYQICTSPVQLPFYRHLSWHFPYALDTRAMHQGAEALLGTHDFSTFCNARRLWTRSPICTLDRILLEPLPEKRWRISLRGDRFLYNMARNLVGTLAYVGCGKLHAEDLPQIVESHDRTCAGVTAPAHGLCLKHVFY